MIVTLPYQPLTPRQLQIAALYVDTDLTPQQIGTRLGLHRATVVNIGCQVYRAFGVRSRAALRSVMLELELAPVGDAR